MNELSFKRRVTFSAVDGDLIDPNDELSRCVHRRMERDGSSGYDAMHAARKAVLRENPALAERLRRRFATPDTEWTESAAKQPPSGSIYERADDELLRRVRHLQAQGHSFTTAKQLVMAQDPALAREYVSMNGTKG